MTREERKTYIKAFYNPMVYGELEHLVDEIYDDFEDELKKTYVEGSNDAWKTRDESIEKAIISVEDDYGWIAYEDKQNCIEILYELRGH